MIINQKEENFLNEKQAKLIPSCLFPENNNDQLVSQADFTEKCDLLSSQMASIFNFEPDLSNSYDIFLNILDDLLAMNTDTINFPFNTFCSYFIPRMLTILIKEFPDSDVYFKSLEVSKILSQNVSCAIQFCNNDFIQLILQNLSSLFQAIDEENISFILLLLDILSNIFCNPDNEMLKYCSSIFDLLELISEMQNEEITERILLILSNMLKCHQYNDHTYLIDITSFLIDYLDENIQYPYSKILSIFQQIMNADVSKETIPIIINQTTIPILISLTSKASSEIIIDTITMFISFLKKSEDEYKEIIYDALSWEWFETIWNSCQQEVRKYLIELFYYLIYYNKDLLQSAIDDQIISMIFDSLESSSFSIRMIIVQNIIRVVLLNNVDFLLLLTGNNFFDILDEFLSITCIEMLPFIINFYYYVFQLIENGEVEFEFLDMENLHEQLIQINAFDLKFDIAKKLKIIINDIEKADEKS